MCSIVRVAKDQVCCDLGGEAAILGLKSGVYYGLNSVGTRIWNLVQQPRTVQEIRDVIVKEYEVEPDRCENDILILLGKLLAEGLIEVENGPAT